MKLFQNIIIVGVIATSLIACSKDKDEKRSPEQLLTNGTWKRTGFSSTKAGTTMADCRLDDFYTYNANGTVVFDNGAVKCDPAWAQTDTATWALIQNKTYIDQFGDYMEIIELTDKKMKLRYNYKVNSVAYYDEYAFSH